MDEDQFFTKSASTRVNIINTKKERDRRKAEEEETRKQLAQAKKDEETAAKARKQTVKKRKATPATPPIDECYYDDDILTEGNATLYDYKLVENEFRKSAKKNRSEAVDLTLASPLASIAPLARTTTSPPNADLPPKQSESKKEIDYLKKQPDEQKRLLELVAMSQNAKLEAEHIRSSMTVANNIQAKNIHLNCQQRWKMRKVLQEETKLQSFVAN